MLNIFIIKSHHPEERLKKMIRILKNDGGIVVVEGGIVISKGEILKNEGRIVTNEGGILKNEGGIVTKEGGILKNKGGILALAMLLPSPYHHPPRMAVPSLTAFLPDTNIRAAHCCELG